MDPVAAKPANPSKPLRVLIAEDNPEDVELCLWELKKGGFDISLDLAGTQEKFKEFVRSKAYDIIVSDYNLRGWNALDAIQIIQEEGKDIPFVLVTGSLGDEDAVECVKKGISDYVLEDRMARLPVAIRRALQEKTERDERRHLEEQLQRAQKMEAIGRLAGGVAHDFNNLLTVMTGYSQLLMERLQEDDPLRDYLVEIKKAGDRATALTRQLLAFSRKQVLAPQVIDLNRVVFSMNQMLSRLIGEDIELVTIGHPSLWRVKADPGQIENVIMNLAVNARDAMPQGGKLTIETANINLDRNYPDRHQVATPGPYAVLAMSDTGIGMNQETQSRIFEPFFTTKEQGRGTGLGLATVYGIIKQSGGYIRVYSDPGKGATFKIYLPRVEETIDDVKETEPGAYAAAGSGTILVVEDDMAVRGFVRGVLESKGYTLLEAGSCEEALKVAEIHAGPIHLLLTDVVMARMSGPELAGHIAPIHPEAKVLYMSGYTDNAIVRHGALDPQTHFLQKPFSPEVLARRVHEVLENV